MEEEEDAQEKQMEPMEDESSAHLTKNQKRKLKKKKREKHLKDIGIQRPKKPRKKDSGKQELPIEEDEKQSLPSMKKEMEDGFKNSKSEQESEEIDPVRAWIQKLHQDSLEKSTEEEIVDFFGEILKKMQEHFQQSCSSDPDEAKKVIETTQSFDRFVELLKKKKIPKKMLKSLQIIKLKLLKRKYEEAEQYYFQFSIGSSTWLSTSSTSSLLDEEEKREILKGMKRLMTFWRTKIDPPFITQEQRDLLAVS